MLLDWGVKQAQKEKVSAFLEAAVDAVPLYEKSGFKRVGEQRILLEQFGWSEPFAVARMAANVD